jgi:hypothetical protein
MKTGMDSGGTATHKGTALPNWTIANDAPLGSRRYKYRW